METRQLVFFRKVAELEHMTKAAEELQVSQPSLSHCIAELENEVGVRLFDRVGRGIVLNDFGKAFYRQVVKISTSYEDALHELKDLSQTQNNNVNLLTNVALYLPPLMKKLIDAAPEISVRIFSARRYRILRDLSENKADFAICCPPIQEPGLTTLLLLNERGVIIYPEGHWLKDRKTVHITDLAKEYFISGMLGYGTRDATEEYFKKFNIRQNIIVEASDTTSIFDFVKSGVGIAIAPHSLVVQNSFFLEHYVPLSNPEPSGEVGLTFKQNSYQRKACEVFSDTTLEYFREIEKRSDW